MIFSLLVSKVMAKTVGNNLLIPVLGNHELYLSEVAYLTFNQFAKVWGDKYLTSNVEIMNPTTGEFEYIGAQYRYFTTQHGKWIKHTMGGSSSNNVL